MTKLFQKTILITGAAGGFGEQFVRHLLPKENKLILTDLNDEEMADKGQIWMEEIGQGTILATLGGDLSTAEGVNTLYKRVMELGYDIDVLINNAGIAAAGRHDEVPQDVWERLMQVNLLSPMRLTNLISPHMITRGSGHIVNLCSMASWVADRGMASYFTSKHGLRAYSEAISSELEEFNVKVSAIYPYFSRTPILNSPRYGSYANSLPSDISMQRGVTDPADVIRYAIEKIEEDALHIFPDPTGRFIYRLNRFYPRLFNVIRRRFSP